MSFPTAVCRIAFGEPALSGTPAWGTVSDDLMGYSLRRGRQYELDRVEPGELTVTLKNTSGDYWPDNGASPHSPNVAPGCQLNLRQTYGGSTYDRFTGLVERWQHRFIDQGGTRVPVVDVTAAEVTKVLARTELAGTSYPEQNSGTRVAAVADTVGWPTNKRSINTGQSSVQASGTIEGNTSAFDHLDAVRQAEQGLLWQKPDMTLVWQDRHARLKAPYDASVGTVGVTAADWPYREPQFSYDDSRIFNDVTIIRQDGGTKTSTDSASQSSYGKRRYRRDSVPTTTDLETQDQADYIKARHKEPDFRITNLTLKPGNDPDTLFPAVLARDLGDRVTVKLPSGSVSEDYHIEGIEEDVAGRDWTTRWAFSPVDQQQYWVLGVSQLGIDTRLAF